MSTTNPQDFGDTGATGQNTSGARELQRSFSENHLRSDRGHPAIPLNDFASADSRTSFSIEYIAAQTADTVDSSKIEIPGQTEECSRRWLHAIGNLVLDTRAENSRKGNEPYFQKQEIFGKAPLLSQIELREFAEARGYGTLLWNEGTIQNRARKLIELAEARWDPSAV